MAKPLSPAREAFLLNKSSRRRLKNPDKWARSFARTLSHNKMNEGK